jgi:hypothetical protein
MSLHAESRIHHPRWDTALKPPTLTESKDYARAVSRTDPSEIKADCEEYHASIRHSQGNVQRIAADLCGNLALLASRSSR